MTLKMYRVQMGGKPVNIKGEHVQLWGKDATNRTLLIEMCEQFTSPERDQKGMEENRRAKTLGERLFVNLGDHEDLTLDEVDFLHKVVKNTMMTGIARVNADDILSGAEEIEYAPKDSKKKEPTKKGKEAVRSEKIENKPAEEEIEKDED